MIAEGVASAIVNDDFEQVLSDILSVEEAGYEKGCETFSPRLAERVRLVFRLQKNMQTMKMHFLRKSMM